jgi:hypothetical protein
MTSAVPYLRDDAFEPHLPDLSIAATFLRSGTKTTEVMEVVCCGNVIVWSYQVTSVILANDAFGRKADASEPSHL